jgi:putative flippase GtrA
MQASAETNTLGISITENMNRADVYTPDNPGVGGTTATGTLSGDGTVTITNNLASTDLYEVNVVFTKGSTTSWAVSSGSATLTDDSPAAGQATVHITQLQHGQSVSLTYTVNPTATLPVHITATYDSNKVNIGGSTTVHLTATKDSSAIASDVAGITVRVVPRDIDSDSVKDWIFSAPSAGATVSATDGSITWSPSALTTAVPSATMDFTATENDANAHTDSSQDVQLYDMASTSISYTMTSTTGTEAGVSVSGHPTATTTGITSDLSKAFVSGNSWTFTPKVTNSNAEDVTFTLNTVTFWATLNNNLNSPGSTLQTFTPGQDLDKGESWTTSAIPINIGGTPAGFIKSAFTVTDTATQMPRSYVSANGASGVTLLKKIWVMNGYNVEVTKAIQSLGSDSFRITITVTNTGSKATPPNVLVYDIVPSTFTAGTMNSPAPIGQTAVSVAGITGEAYWWNVGPLAAGASTTITYVVTGSGDYPLSDVFLIGVDPAQSINLQSTPALNSNATVMNSNLEPVLAAGVLCLVVIGLIGTVRRKF